MHSTKAAVVMGKNGYDYCVGSADAALRKALVLLLMEAGFVMSGEAKSVPGFLRLLRLKQPWLAVIDTRLPPGSIRQLASIIEEDSLAAPLLIDMANQDLSGHMLLKWPVDGRTLAAVAEALCLEFARKKKLIWKISGLETKLQERKEIDRAKGIVMKKMKLDEEEAYRYLRDMSMKERLSMGEAARLLISRRFENDYSGQRR